MTFPLDLWWFYVYLGMATLPVTLITTRMIIFLVGHSYTPSICHCYWDGASCSFMLHSCLNHIPQSGRLLLLFRWRPRGSHRKCWEAGRIHGIGTWPKAGQDCCRAVAVTLSCANITASLMNLSRFLVGLSCWSTVGFLKRNIWCTQTVQLTLIILKSYPIPTNMFGF